MSKFLVTMFPERAVSLQSDQTLYCSDRLLASTGSMQPEGFDGEEEEEEEEEEERKRHAKKEKADNVKRQQRDEDSEKVLQGCI